MELPVSRPHREGEGGDPRQAAEEHPRHRLEGADQTVYSLPIHGRQRQEAHRCCRRMHRNTPGVASRHEPVGVELPVFVAPGTKPLAAGVMRLVSETHGNTIALPNS